MQQLLLCCAVHARCAVSGSSGQWPGERSAAEQGGGEVLL